MKTKDAILKALDCCGREPEFHENCVELCCPYSDRDYGDFCVSVLCRDAAALIRGQEGGDA